MSTRPIFLVRESYPYYIEWNVEFVYNKGLSASQKQKNIIAIHEKFRSMFPHKDILEISSKSLQDVGIKLSAFNMKKYVPSLGKKISVENIYQAGKVFENGGNYEDLYHVSAKDAKRDERLKNSGRLIGFKYEGRDIPANPVNLFYDYIYINALFENEELANKMVEFDGFTDIEFSPRSSINCQARAAAVYTSLYRMGLIDKVRDFDSFYELMTNSSSREKTEEKKENDETVKSHISISEGDILLHKTYGKGKVISVNDSVVTVEFCDKGEKKLSRTWAENNCEISDN